MPEREPARIVIPRRRSSDPWGWPPPRVRQVRKVEVSESAGGRPWVSAYSISRYGYGGVPIPSTFGRRPSIAMRCRPLRPMPERGSV